MGSYQGAVEVGDTGWVVTRALLKWVTHKSGPGDE